MSVHQWVLLVVMLAPASVAVSVLAVMNSDWYQYRRELRKLYYLAKLRDDHLAHLRALQEAVREGGRR